MTREMSTTWRNIKPKPTGFVTPQIQTEKKAKKANVKVACRRCRIKKIKCDGVQPSCGICDSGCIYDEKAEQALIRSLQHVNANLRQKNEQLSYRVQSLESLLKSLITAHEQTGLGMPFKQQSMESMALGHFYAGQLPGPATEQQPATPSHCLTGLSSAQPDPGLVASDALGKAPAPMPFDMNLLHDFGQGMVGEVLTGQALLQHLPDSEPP